MVLIYTKDFPWGKKDPNSSDFELKKFQMARVYDKLQKVAKNREGFFFFFFGANFQI
jgi:hypothetical protein